MGDWLYLEAGLDSLEKEKSILPLPVAEPLILRCPPLNLLTPNVNYSGRTAPLTSKVASYIFIQQI